MKSLVVYYSRTGKTKFVAELIAAEFVSDLEEVVDLKSREGKMGWMSATRDASSEKETQISPLKKSPHDYELVIIGSPVWAFNITPAIRSYIKTNDLTGKKTALFFTYGMRLGQTIEKTRSLLVNSQFVDDLSVVTSTQSNQDIQKKVVSWCNSLKAKIQVEPTFLPNGNKDKGQALA